MDYFQAIPGKRLPESQNLTKSIVVTDWQPACHENNGAAIYVGRRPRPCIILCFNVHNTPEYFNSHVSIGQLLQHISKSIMWFVPIKVKMLTKTYNKEVQLPCTGFITHNDGTYKASVGRN